MYNDFDIRMKTYYEKISDEKLMRRCPVIIRFDGVAFHTFTKGFNRPFDHVLMKTMQETMQFLCKNIQGAKIGYCQSDEISLLLVDYNNLDSQAWFDYRVQKMCSVGASMATMAFNQFLAINIFDFSKNKYSDFKNLDLNDNYEKASKKERCSIADVSIFRKKRLRIISIGGSKIV